MYSQHDMRVRYDAPMVALSSDPQRKKVACTPRTGTGVAQGSSCQVSGIVRCCSLEPPERRCSDVQPSPTARHRPSGRRQQKLPGKTISIIIREARGCNLHSRMRYVTSKTDGTTPHLWWCILFCQVLIVDSRVASSLCRMG